MKKILNETALKSRSMDKINQRRDVSFLSECLSFGLVLHEARSARSCDGAALTPQSDHQKLPFEVQLFKTGKPKCSESSFFCLSFRAF